MEAPEVPLEEVQEHIKHHAEHGATAPEKRWVLGVALSSAVLAALAAVAALLAGDRINEALILQIRASDQWAYYQAKSIKSGQLQSKLDVLAALGRESNAKDEDKRRQYEGDLEHIKEEATKLEHESEILLRSHRVLAQAVTMFQVAIAVAAISVLTQRRPFWFVGLGFGAIGLFFLVRGLLVH